MQNAKIDIKKELAALGIRNRDLVLELGVSKAMVSLVVNGKTGSTRIQKYLAARIGADPEDCFPGYRERNHRKTKPEAPENQEKVGKD